MPKPPEEQSVVRVCTAGFLAWLLPGLGHIYVGQRTRGLIYLFTIGITFWGGVAIGGVHDTVDPQRRLPWFLAQVCTGGHALAAYGWTHHIRPVPDAAKPVNSSFASVDIGIVYTGIAGLLNLLAILDALARSDAPPRVAQRVTVAHEARGKK